jgi:hypothetical protein
MSHQPDNNSAGRQVASLIDETPPGPRFSRLRKVLIIGAAGLIVLSLCIGLAVLHSRAEKRRAWAEIQKRLEAIRAAGEPVTADDLAKMFPHPSPELDANLLLAQAIAALREPDSSEDVPFLGGGEMPSGNHALTLQMRTNIEAILHDNMLALDAIPWNKMRSARFRWNFALGFTNAPNEHEHQVLVLGRMLCLKAVIEAESGNGNKASESLRHSLVLFHSFESDVLVHHLGRRTGETCTCDALERVINRAGISAEDLAALEQVLSDDDSDGLRKFFLSTRCQNILMMLGVRNALTNMTVPSDRMLDAIFGLSRRLYMDTDFSEMLDVRAAQIAALKLPPKQCFAEFSRLKTQFASDGRRKTIASGIAGSGLDFSKQPVLDAEIRAKLQVTRVALEVERWRLAHGGRAPDSLAELAPEFAASVPLDPFDNNPLRYKKLARGFLVYSIGADFTDDGGKEKKADEADEAHYDITFRVER